MRQMNRREAAAAKRTSATKSQFCAGKPCFGGFSFTYCDVLDDSNIVVQISFPFSLCPRRRGAAVGASESRQWMQPFIGQSPRRGRFENAGDKFDRLSMPLRYDMNVVPNDRAGVQDDSESLNGVGKPAGDAINLWSCKTDGWEFQRFTHFPSQRGIVRPICKRPPGGRFCRRSERPQMRGPDFRGPRSARIVG